MKAEMAELDSMQTEIMQAAIQAATVAVVEMKEVDTGPTSGNSKPTQERCTDLGKVD